MNKVDQKIQKMESRIDAAVARVDERIEEI